MEANATRYSFSFARFLRDDLEIAADELAVFDGEIGLVGGGVASGESALEAGPILRADAEL